MFSLLCTKIIVIDELWEQTQEVGRECHLHLIEFDKVS